MNNYDYLIGIDFGAGETCASYYDINGKQTAEDGERLHRLSFVNTGDVYKVYSAIRFIDNKWQLLTNPNDFSFTDLDVNFKKRVCDMSHEQKENNKIFWGLVFSSILEANNNFLSYDNKTGTRNFMLAVARPSSWTREDEDDYLVLMREAGLPVDMIMKESDAALTKWIQHTSKGNTLIVDCGSSSIDLSLTCDGDSYGRPLFSCEPPQGAQRVEELLLEMLKKDPQFVDACQVVTEHLLQHASKLDLDKAIRLYIRKVKEYYYSFSPSEVEFSLKKRYFTKESGFILDSIISSECFEETVNPYFDKLRLFFENVRDTLRRDRIQVSSIVLSGGASRMPKVKSILSSVFGVNTDDIFHDKLEASFIVSDGLALSLRHHNQDNLTINDKKKGTELSNSEHEQTDEVYYIISQDLCLGCGECAEQCPAKAISLLGSTYDINQDYCISCGYCEELCPNEAIEQMIEKHSSREKHSNLTTDNDNIIEKIKSILSEKLGVEIKDISLDSSLEDDLGADSLDGVELLMEFERAYGIKVPDEEIAHIRTVADIVDKIKEKLPK